MSTERLRIVLDLTSELTDDEVVTVIASLALKRGEKGGAAPGHWVDSDTSTRRVCVIGYDLEVKV